MSKLYLITGFLGAGKTTFLKTFIRLFAGQKIQLIVNEFGKEGVDGALLSDLGAYLQEISGGSVFCSCRLDQFEKVLRESAEIDADVILVEASGLSDPTGVRRLFSQTDRFAHIEYMGGVCLIDAVRFPKLYATARTCIKQLASSDVAVVNKIDRASEEQLAQTLALVRGQRPDMPIIKTSFGQADGTLLDLLSQAQTLSDGDMPLTADLTLKQLNIHISPDISAYDLQKFIEMFLEDTFRVKGFVQTTEGMCLVDCVGNVASVTPYAIDVPEEKCGWLTVLSGAGMPVRRAVKEACKWYEKYVIAVE
ncbi:CobW family GTP-binding protein [Butyricicoccus sp. Marseille-Q5471]|uniref:CobW family GTP-binding protein n=1 Tax=Butyricicoccus sp. Marseille-Q5471 TaxID=3039493 RepID=UPI0024BC73CF|nr:GTP-binding protein [Butyricicoccus sp. Marseille-Q5471]